MIEPVKNAKVAVVGGRDFTDWAYLNRIVSAYHERHGIAQIVSGGAKGADTLAERWAHENEVDLLVLMAKWSEDGKAAGPRRNARVVEACDVMLAFSTGGPGTANAVHLAGVTGKPVWVFGGEK